MKTRLLSPVFKKIDLLICSETQCCLLSPCQHTALICMHMCVCVCTHTHPCWYTLLLHDHLKQFKDRVSFRVAGSWLRALRSSVHDSQLPLFVLVDHSSANGVWLHRSHFLVAAGLGCREIATWLKFVYEERALQRYITSKWEVETWSMYLVLEAVAGQWMFAKGCSLGWGTERLLL